MLLLYFYCMSVSEINWGWWWWWYIPLSGAITVLPIDVLLRVHV